MSRHHTDTLTGVPALTSMLSFRRPGRTKAERHFIRRFLEPLGTRADRFGNHIIRIGSPRVLWSSHTDTVHKQGGRQSFVIEKGIASLPEGSQSNCLGADCTAGIWLMREMILANKPGLYVFHRDEESGGLGSSYIARNTPDLMCGIDYAIAFDRRGQGDVITHQAGARCCSDTFAHALSESLGDAYAPSSSGVFTDTANYVDHVSECSNISVGYDSEHTKRETLSVSHLVELRERLLALDVERLPTVREPGSFEPKPRGHFSGRFGLWDDDGEHVSGRQTLANIVRDYPDDIADILEAYGLSADDIMKEIHAARGYYR